MENGEKIAQKLEGLRANIKDGFDFQNRSEYTKLLRKIKPTTQNFVKEFGAVADHINSSIENLLNELTNLIRTHRHEVRRNFLFRSPRK